MTQPELNDREQALRNIALEVLRDSDIKLSVSRTVSSDSSEVAVILEVTGRDGGEGQFGFHIDLLGDGTRTGHFATVRQSETTGPMYLNGQLAEGVVEEAISRFQSLSGQDEFDSANFS